MLVDIECNHHVQRHATYKSPKPAGLRATQACRRKIKKCTAVVGGLSMSRISTAIRSPRCSIGIILGHLGGHFLISTSWFSRKSLVVRIVRGRASSWTRKKMFWKVDPAQGKRLCCNTCHQVHLLVHGVVQHSRLTFATIVKSSPYDDRWTDDALKSI